MKNNNSNRNVNSSINPTNALKLSEHRPIRWIVRQYFTHNDGFREEIVTGYHCKLDNIKGMTSSLGQAISNLQKYGGELMADYGDLVNGPVLVKTYS
jgi:hypothetical protein